MVASRYLPVLMCARGENGNVDHVQFFLLLRNTRARTKVGSADSRRVVEETYPPGRFVCECSRVLLAQVSRSGTEERLLGSKKNKVYFASLHDLRRVYTLISSSPIPQGPQCSRNKLPLNEFKITSFLAAAFVAAL